MHLELIQSPRTTKENYRRFVHERFQEQLRSRTSLPLRSGISSEATDQSGSVELHTQTAKVGNQSWTKHHRSKVSMETPLNHLESFRQWKWLHPLSELGLTWSVAVDHVVSTISSVSRDLIRAVLRSERGFLMYCLSDNDLRNARPILPHNCEAPNMSLPLNFPAWPGESRDELMIESISSCNSSFLELLILRHIALRS